MKTHRPAPYDALPEFEKLDPKAQEAVHHYVMAMHPPRTGRANAGEDVRLWCEIVAQDAERVQEILSQEQPLKRKLFDYLNPTEQQAVLWQARQDIAAEATGQFGYAPALAAASEAIVADPDRLRQAIRNHKEFSPRTPPPGAAR